VFRPEKSSLPSLPEVEQKCQEYNRFGWCSHYCSYVIDTRFHRLHCSLFAFVFTVAPFVTPKHADKDASDCIIRVPACDSVKALGDPDDARSNLTSDAAKQSVNTVTKFKLVDYSPGSTSISSRK
jgi:hypothetical protein